MGIKPARRHYKLSKPVLMIVLPGMVLALVVVNVSGNTTWRRVAALFVLAGIPTLTITAPIYLVGRFLGTERKPRSGSTSGGKVGMTKYECENCGETLTSRDDVNGQSPYRCAYCGHELNDQFNANDLYHWEWL